MPTGQLKRTMHAKDEEEILEQIKTSYEKLSDDNTMLGKRKSKSISLDKATIR